MSSWKPPEWEDTALSDDGSSFLNEKKRHTGKGMKDDKKAKKKKRKRAKSPTSPKPRSDPEPDPEPEPEPEPRDWLFDMLQELDPSTLDTNGNGTIELSEFQAYFKEINPDLAETIFYDIDADKDKYLTTTEYEVWKAALTLDDLQYLRDNYQLYPVCNYILRYIRTFALCSRFLSLSLVTHSPFCIYTQNRKYIRKRKKNLLLNLSQNRNLNQNQNQIQSQCMSLHLNHNLWFIQNLWMDPRYYQY